MVVKAAASLPRTIFPGFMVVVSIRSSVCLSLSPLMLLEVRAGMINISIINSRDATNT